MSIDKTPFVSLVKRTIEVKEAYRGRTGRSAVG